MCQVLYTLSARGPAADAEENFKTVYAGDITTISDPVFDIRDEHKQIPLTVLSKGQFLEFYAFAVLGRGRDHAKWSPVAAVGFRPQHRRPQQAKEGQRAVRPWSNDHLTVRPSTPNCLERTRK